MPAVASPPCSAELQTVHKVLAILFVILGSACSHQGTSADAQADAALTGEAIVLACPKGRLGVLFPWHYDPAQAGIRYIRDPGNLQRCLPLHTNAVIFPGQRVALAVRETELVVVGPALPARPRGRSAARQ